MINKIIVKFNIRRP